MPHRAPKISRKPMRSSSSRKTPPPPRQNRQQAPATDAAMRATPQAAAQVGSEIIRRFNGQDTSFQLRLDPPELGRVDIRLDVSRDHRVTAIISADSPQALSDLARGARDLQQALQSAGLDLADDGLRFDLSSNGQGNSFAQAQTDQPIWRATPNATPNQAATPEPIATRPLSIDSWRGARVDLMA
jgi:flagellar hook-length control protein FliK